MKITVRRIASVFVACAALGGVASIMSTASAVPALPCPNVFAPVCCLSGGCFDNQCLADRAGASGCWEQPVDPYPGPGSDDQ